MEEVGVKSSARRIFAALAVVVSLSPSGLVATVSTSSTTKRMMQDLEAMGNIQTNSNGQFKLNQFFDQNNSRVTVSGPKLSVVNPRGQVVDLSRMKKNPTSPISKNPAVLQWLKNDARLVYAGQGRYYFWPPPTKVYAYAPNPFPYDNRGFGVPYTGFSRRLGLGYGGQIPPGYGGYIPPGGGYIPPGYGGFGQQSYGSGLLPQFGYDNEYGQFSLDNFGLNGLIVNGIRRFIPQYDYYPLDRGGRLSGYRYVPGSGFLPPQ